jgi:signal transduction histidine kinase
MKIPRSLPLALLVLLQLLPQPATRAQADDAWRVFLVYSYGRDFAPLDRVGTEFRLQLARRASRPVEFYEVPLDTARWIRNDEGDDAALVQFLQSRFSRHRPDLVVVLGEPAARFLLARRRQILPSVPILVGGVEPRMLGNVAPSAQDAMVGVRIDFVSTINSLLALRPSTRNVMVILGASLHERLWQDAMQRELAGFADRVAFTWTNELSLEQMRSAVAALPRDSAILYGMLSVDATGAPHEQGSALQQLHAVARVPMFGVFDTQLGEGIVGGPLISLSEVGSAAADSAARLLAGYPPPSYREIGASRLLFDWRQLARWQIPESRLPPGSIVEYRPSTLWDQYSALIVTGLGIILLQAAFIVALTFQYMKRRRAEGEARDLNQRLLSANEDERRRLARDLHDDFSHRLARLSIDAAQLEHSLPTDGGPRIVQGIRHELSQLSEDIHAVSHQLHPAVLEDLGLVDALRTEGDLLARLSSLSVAVNVEEVPARLPPEIALCAFRVAQEALRNIARHARASAVSISVEASGDELRLAIRDNGVGFDISGPAHHAGLGHASMRERVRLLGGMLRIRSLPGRGTTIETHLPLSPGIP